MEITYEKLMRYLETASERKECKYCQHYTERIGENPECNSGEKIGKGSIIHGQSFKSGCDKFSLNQSYQ